MLNRNIRSGGDVIPRSTITSIIMQAKRLDTLGCHNFMRNVMMRHGITAFRLWDDFKSCQQLADELPVYLYEELMEWITDEQDLFDREVARFTQVGEHS